MALSKETLAELAGEADRLAAELTRIDAEVTALNKKRIDVLESVNALRKLIGSQAVAPLELDSAPPAETSLADSSLGEAIKKILMAAPEPMRPAAITESLRRSGYTHSGKTDLATLVHNELYRMNKRSEVTRGDEGYDIVDKDLL